MSTTRRLSVDVVGGSASSFMAMMNRVTSGVTRFGSGLGTMNRNAQQSSRWLQAMSTTLRYAFAGRVIFGIQNAVQNLGEFKTQLGQVDALAARLQKNGQLQGLGGQLDEVGKSALLMSNRYGIAVGDVEAYNQRFFSSFNPKGNAKQRVAEMKQYTDAMLNLTASLGSEAGDPQKLAGGLTGLINALPGGRKNPGRSALTISNYFAQLLKSTPGLTGADVATAAGRFASAKSLAKMSIPQIMSAFGVAAQTGGSPAVIIRGMTQLLGQSLLHPTRPQSLRTYQQAGLPTDPNALAGMGGQKVLERLIGFVQEGGAPGSKGRKLNLDAIYNAFSRQESVRQFVNILANGGVPALKAFNKSLVEGNKANIVTQMANTRLRQSLLLRMRNASTNAGIALMQGADWPLENLIARPTIFASNEMIKHPKVTQGIVGGALSLGAANALRRLGAFGRFGSLGRFIGGASAAEQAIVGGAISKSELPNAIAGGATDGTRGNPFWVIIAPLSWSLGGPQGMSGAKSSSEAKKLIDDAKKVATGGGIAKALRLSKFGEAGTALAAGGVIWKLGKMFGDSAPKHSLFDLQKKGWFTHGDVVGMIHSVPGNDRDALLNAIMAANAKGANLTHQTLRKMELTGDAKGTFIVKLVDANGRVITVTEEKGIPIKMKAKTFPTSQGKPGSRKGST